MENPTNWQELLKIRKSMQRAFSGLNRFKKIQYEKTFKRLLSILFCEIVNPENEKVNICVYEENNSTIPTIIRVTISGTHLSALNKIYFYNCKCEYILNEIREALVSRDIKFVDYGYNTATKLGVFEINLPSEQQGT